MFNVNNLNNFPTPVPVTRFYVHIVDSPSAVDMAEGYSIGMALRDALKAIRIPHTYTFAANVELFKHSLVGTLHKSLCRERCSLNDIVLPFIHLCMHGNDGGVSFTDNSFYSWYNLKQDMFQVKNIIGNDPFLCMASCNGIKGIDMVDSSNKVFDFIVGNQGAVCQSDLTVGYLTFYHSLFHKGMNVDGAVSAMKAASSNGDFYYAVGEVIRQNVFRQMQETSFPNVNNPWIQPGN